MTDAQPRRRPRRPRGRRPRGDDVTGFGLLGHLHEMALASGVAAEVDARSVPAIDGVTKLLAVGERAIAGGTKRNRAYAETFTTWGERIPPPQRWLGLRRDDLRRPPRRPRPDRAAEVPGTVVGRLVAGEPGTITVGG
jgi:selenide,water dikinase